MPGHVKDKKASFIHLAAKVKRYHTVLHIKQLLFCRVNID